MKKKNNTKLIRESLITQLVERGADIELNRKLVDDYIYYCVEETKMQADVAENGYMIPAISSTGKEYKRENPAVKMAVLYNKQKLAILGQLDISPATIVTAIEAESRDDDL